MEFTGTLALRVYSGLPFIPATLEISQSVLISAVDSLSNPATLRSVLISAVDSL